MSKSKLSADFIRANNVTFAPATSTEATAIQKWLFRHGIKWADSKDTVSYIKECMQHGMVVQSGKIYWNNGGVSGLPATIGDLDKSFKTPEEKTQTKIDRLEREVKALHAKIDLLVTMLTPANLEKPPLVAKKAAGRTP